MVKPKFTKDFLDVVMHEGAEPANVRDSPYGPPLVDEDLHAICQTTSERNARTCITSV